MNLIRLTPNEASILSQVLGDWLERYGNPKPQGLERVDRDRIQKIRELKERMKSSNG